jgi:hypothetical protein
MYDHVINKFKWGNMEDPSVNIDDNNARMVMNMRNILGRLANALADEGKKDSARTVIETALKYMPDDKVNFDYFMIPIATACFKIADTATGNMIVEKVTKYKSEELAYFFSFPVKDLKEMDINIQEALISVNQVSDMTKKYGQEKQSKAADDVMQQYYNQYMEKVYQRNR